MTDTAPAPTSEPDLSVPLAAATLDTTSIPIDTAAQTDPFVVRLVVIGLILASLGSIAAITWLTGVGREVPDSLAYTTATSLGALAGVLISTRSRA